MGSWPMSNPTENCKIKFKITLNGKEIAMNAKIICLNNCFNSSKKKNIRLILGSEKKKG